LHTAHDGLADHFWCCCCCCRYPGILHANRCTLIPALQWFGILHTHTEKKKDSHHPTPAAGILTSNPISNSPTSCTLTSCPAPDNIFFRARTRTISRAGILTSNGPTSWTCSSNRSGRVHCKCSSSRLEVMVTPPSTQSRHTCAVLVLRCGFSLEDASRVLSFTPYLA
jgi:hypothetical protein